MRRNGQIIAEQAKHIVELELSVKDLEEKLRLEKLSSQRQLQYARDRNQRLYGAEMARQSRRNELMHENARLQNKLLRRSRELGIQRAEVKKIDAMYCQAAEESENVIASLQGTIKQLDARLDVLNRLVRVHFTYDEVEREIANHQQVPA